MHGNQIFIHNFASEKNKEWLSPIVLRYHFLRGQKVYNTDIRTTFQDNINRSPVTVVTLSHIGP